MGGLLSGELVITRGAVEKARRLLPSLARASDDDARVALLANVKSSLALHAPIETVDHRDGEPQTIAMLGVSTDPWGAALIKDCTVVTVLDRDGVRLVVGRGRARLAAVKPALEPVEALANELHRFAVQGWPGVEALVVMPDGSAAVHCIRRPSLTSPPRQRLHAKPPIEPAPQWEPPAPQSAEQIDGDNDIAQQQPRPLWKRNARA